MTMLKITPKKIIKANILGDLIHLEFLSKMKDQPLSTDLYYGIVMLNSLLHGAYLDYQDKMNGVGIPSESNDRTIEIVGSYLSKFNFPNFLDESVISKRIIEILEKFEAVDTTSYNVTSDSVERSFFVSEEQLRNMPSEYRATIISFSQNMYN